MLANWDNDGTSSVKRILWDDTEIIVENNSNIFLHEKNS